MLTYKDTKKSDNHQTNNQDYFLFAKLALRFYHEAAVKADTINPITDRITLSRIYAHSAKLFLAHFDCRPTLALEEARKALHYAKAADNQMMIDICNEQMGNCFFALGLWDSIKVYDPHRYECMFHPWRSIPDRTMFKYKSFLPLINRYNDNQKVEVSYRVPLDSIPNEIKTKGNFAIFLGKFIVYFPEGLLVNEFFTFWIFHFCP